MFFLNNKIQIYSVVLILSLFLLTGCSTKTMQPGQTQSQGSQTVTIKMLDIGQGDSILSILIDTVCEP